MMRSNQRFEERRCWVDLFPTRQFGGSLKRVFGPCKIDPTRIASLIVGPEARVEMTVRRGKKDIVMNLDSNHLETDLPKQLRGGKIRQIVVHHDGQNNTPAAVKT